MKKIALIICAISLALSFESTIYADNSIKSTAESETQNLAKEAKSAILMDANTGMILFEKNSESSLPPASVTKIMTLLLCMEALDAGSFNLSDKTVISANAASMGGSQVYLEEGESMSVEELIKCTAIASANDAAVAIAELVSGSEAAFVRKMNAKAMELGLKSTVFENATGLDDSVVNHVTSSKDIAIMSKELLKYETITTYASTWQDTIRDGEFTLTNTNRLVRYYDGCNGLKTGSTDKAGYCMSASAKRNGLQLIAVVMGASTRDSRNAIAKELLDYGFANYSLYICQEEKLERCKVLFGVCDSVDIYSEQYEMLVQKSDLTKIEKKYNIEQSLKAPICKSEKLGTVEYYLDGEKIGESIIFAKVDIGKIGFWELYWRLIISVLS